MKSERVGMKKDDWEMLGWLGQRLLQLSPLVPTQARACREAVAALERLAVDRDCYRRYFKEVVVLRAVIESLEAENEKLRAKLHKTRDGEPVVEGDIVFTVEQDGSICKLPLTWYGHQGRATLLAHGLYKPSECYSSREAAERRGVFTAITSLPDTSIHVLQPLRIVVKPAGGVSFQASLVDTTISACGESQAEAVDSLKDIVAAKFHLFSQKESILGEQPRQQLRVLRESLREECTLAALQAENEKLRAKMHKTRDGEPVVEGDIVFTVEQDGSICEVPLKWWATKGPAILTAGGGYRSTIGAWCTQWYEPDECYSSREAAEKEQRSTHE